MSVWNRLQIRRKFQTGQILFGGFSDIDMIINLYQSARSDFEICCMLSKNYINFNVGYGSLS